MRRYLLRRPQSVLNATATFISGLSCTVHISSTLANLRWLRAFVPPNASSLNYSHSDVPLCSMLGYSLPSADFTIRVANVPSRRRLRSSSSNGLIVRPSWLVTVGDRAFPVAFPVTCGTVFPTNSLHCSHNFLSGANLRRFWFAHAILASLLGYVIAIVVSDMSIMTSIDDTTWKLR